MAAHIEGNGASVLDFMGFAQKFGPVLSYIRIASQPESLNQSRIDRQQADALIGCDLVVSASPRASRTYRRGHTKAAVNTTEVFTADVLRNRDASLSADARIAAIQNVVGKDRLSTIAANELAEALFGKVIYANVLMLGFAWQRGLVPVSLAAMLRAIELNGVEIENNVRAFSYGRLAAADDSFSIDLLQQPQTTQVSETPERLIARRKTFLVEYQDQALADQFAKLVERARNAEREVSAGESLPLTEAVARSYFKLLAYKDEYEVARLHSTTGYPQNLKKRYGKDSRLRFHLAPPLLSWRKDARGRPVKREFGSWIIPVFALLAKLRRWRGSRLDPFGWTAERQMERQLIVEFEGVVDELLANISTDNIAAAIGTVQLYQDIRGFGPVKIEAAAEVRSKVAAALADYRLSPLRAA